MLSLGGRAPKQDQDWICNVYVYMYALTNLMLCIYFCICGL